MDRDLFYLVAPLANVDKSILGVNLGSRFRIQKWSYKRAIETLELLYSLPSHEVQFILDSKFCVKRHGDPVYNIIGKVQIPKHTEIEKKDILYSSRILDFHIQHLENRLRLMRLFKDGHIDAIAFHWYHKSKSDIEADYSRTSDLSIRYEPYILTEKEKDELNDFLKSTNFPFQLSYLQLAFDSFDESYETDKDHISFLNLMIAVEVLLNVGQHDLRYRTSRGLALLVGNSVEDANQIFSKMKKLYDKRSILVHTGRISEVSYKDVVEIREFTREAIKKIALSGLDKQKLSEKLTESGFGSKLV